MQIGGAHGSVPRSEVNYRWSIANLSTLRTLRTGRERKKERKIARTISFLTWRKEETADRNRTLATPFASHPLKQHFCTRTELRFSEPVIGTRLWNKWKLFSGQGWIQCFNYRFRKREGKKNASKEWKKKRVVVVASKQSIKIFHLDSEFDHVSESSIFFFFSLSLVIINELLRFLHYSLDESFFLIEFQISTIFFFFSFSLFRHNTWLETSIWTKATR